MIKKIIKKIFYILGYHFSSIDKKYKKLSFNDIHKAIIDKDNPIIFDVGANKGQSIRRFKNIFPKSTIHAFEPIKEEFVKLQEEFKNDKSIFKSYCCVSIYTWLLWSPTSLCFNRHHT